MAINGIFRAKQIPLAVADPILKPVYEPGPSEIDTAVSYTHLRAHET